MAAAASSCAAGRAMFVVRCGNVGLDLFQAWEILNCLRSLDGFSVCDLFRRGGAVSCASIHIDIDEGTQAVVLAEVAACVLIACRAVANVADRVEADEGSLATILPKAQRFLRGSDRA